MASARISVIGMVMLMSNLLAVAEVPKEWLTFGGRKSDVDWKAQWIWTDGPPSPRNVYLCARRDFAADGSTAECRLHIAADSRYRLYLNGEWLGDGPARSFYWAQQFDTYDVTGMLNRGKNTLAVLVSHYGEGTFQYDPSGQAGLLLQLESKEGDAWKPITISDDGWRVQRHEGYARPTMRISCQMPFEEIVDGRPMPANWMMMDGNLPHAEYAKVIGPAGCKPWTALIARSIPFLTREPVVPVRLWRSGLVEMPNFHTGFTTRPYLLPGYFMQNHQTLKGFAATIIESPADQAVTFTHRPSRYEPMVINGKAAEDDKPTPLKKGDNLCVIAFNPHNTHEFDRFYAAFLDQPVKLRGVFNDTTEWTIFGPFDNFKEVHDKIKAAKTLAELEPYKGKAQAVRADDIVNRSAWGESTGARPVAGELKIDNPGALFGPRAAVTTITPPAKGCPELFLDFGRELVGQFEIDVEAPAGTTLTFNFLEEIEDGVRIHYADNNFSGLRYITREGRQQFTSFLRKGFRYCKLIVSDMTGPVKIRSLKTILATHPAIENGSFRCSDELLTKIWEVGRHTLLCCSEDTFTDCPMYEQTYWVGDGRNEAMVDYAAYGNLALTRRCAELPALSLNRQLLTESQVPSAWDNILTAWSLLWVLMTEEHYQYSGDRDYLAGIYPSVNRMMHNCREKLMDSRGLLSIEAWNMFDWAGQDSGHAVVTHNQMFLAEALRRSARMARTLGKEDDAKYFDDYRDKLIAAINQHLWSEEKGAYIDSIHRDGKNSSVVSQQTNSLALLYDVAPPDRVKRIQNAPVNPPNGMVTVGSPFALFYILEALAKDNRHADAMKIVRDRWGEMIKHGATSFWETFPGFDKTWWTRSYCHAWSAAPTYFLSRYQLGAWWSEPGYKTAKIAPVPLDLTWAKGSVPTPHGPIHVAWEMSKEKFSINVQLPKNVAGLVELPVPTDQYPNVKAGELKGRKTNDRWQFDLPAGGTATIEASK